MTRRILNAEALDSAKAETDNLHRGRTAIRLMVGQPWETSVKADSARMVIEWLAQVVDEAEEHLSGALDRLDRAPAAVAPND